MSRTPRPRRVAALTGVALAVATGCGAPASGPEAASCEPAAGALVLAVSAHQNAPAPGVPATLGCLIESTVLHGMPISVVGIDGTPQVHPQLTARRFPLRDGNEAALRADAGTAVATVLAAVQSLRADADGADVVTTFGLVHDLAVTGGTEETTAVVVGPMASDSGPLRLTEPGWATAEPAEVADHLAATGQLPDATGLHYRLVGVGYTAAPQEPLPVSTRENLTAIWTEVLQRGGALSVVADPAPRQGEGPDTPFTTATVPVSAPVQPELCPGGARVYDGASAVSFVAEQDTFRDPAAAATALADVARWLAGDPARRASVVGTTANVGDLAGQVALSELRSAAVVRLLVDELGVPAGQLSSDGVGSAFPEFVPDADDPAARQANRTVRITLSGPATGC